MTTATVNQEKENKKKRIALILGICCTMAIAVAGIGAYLTDTTNKVTNKFSVDTDFHITLAEPSWSTADADGNGIPDAAENLTPTQKVAKDPTVTNTSTKMKAWVAMTVKVPVYSGKKVGTDGVATNATDEDLYTYTLEPGWKETGTATVADGYRTHTYVYDTALAPNGTAKLFSEIAVANLAKDPDTKPAAANNLVEVQAHGIQESDAFSTANAAFTAYKTQQAAGITVDAS